MMVLRKNPVLWISPLPEDDNFRTGASRAGEDGVPASESGSAFFFGAQNHRQQQPGKQQQLQGKQILPQMFPKQHPLVELFSLMITAAGVRVSTNMKFMRMTTAGKTPNVAMGMIGDTAVAKKADKSTGARSYTPVEFSGEYYAIM